MAKLILLVVAMGLYVGFLQWGRDLAASELINLQYLYTAAEAQSAAISSGAYPNASSPASTALSLSK